MNYKLNSNYEKIYNNILNITHKYICDHSLKSVVIGLSGGIDSALAAALFYDIKNRFANPIKIIGVSMPIESNKEEEIRRAKLIGDCFCCEFEENNMTRTYSDFLYTGDFYSVWNDKTNPVKIRLGNIKARLRMIKLYDIAHKNNGMVLSTDNLTEYMLGFWTLHGDVGDYGMFQNLWKTEIYGLSEWMINNYNKQKIFSNSNALNECRLATPTDGLGISESDFDQLGVDNYYDIDKALIRYLKTSEYDEKHKSIVGRHLLSEHKRNNPNNISRQKVLK